MVLLVHRYQLVEIKNKQPQKHVPQDAHDHGQRFSDHSLWHDVSVSNRQHGHASESDRVHPSADALSARKYRVVLEKFYDAAEIKHKADKNEHGYPYSSTLEQVSEIMELRLFELIQDGKLLNVVVFYFYKV